MLVVASPERAAQMLLAAEMACPNCAGVLAPYGDARTRIVRGLGGSQIRLRPRRGRCRECGAPRFCCPQSSVPAAPMPPR